MFLVPSSRPKAARTASAELQIETPSEPAPSTGLTTAWGATRGGVKKDPSSALLPDPVTLRLRLGCHSVRATYGTPEAGKRTALRTVVARRGKLPSACGMWSTQEAGTHA